MARSLVSFLFRTKTPPTQVEPPRPPETDAELHVRHHPRAHTYSSVPESFGLGSLLLRPDAA